ncbi:hypothetical protein L218DRAFT_254437 [Marasmius fiardii PR-910]|nr:hypothetical protein L218DRAFT_254437 [Marasmius fiardii PR-910]
MLHMDFSPEHMVSPLPRLFCLISSVPPSDPLTFCLWRPYVIWDGDPADAHERIFRRPSDRFGYCDEAILPLGVFPDEAGVIKWRVSLGSVTPNFKRIFRKHFFSFRPPFIKTLRYHRDRRWYNSSAYLVVRHVVAGAPTVVKFQIRPVGSGPSVRTSIHCMRWRPLGFTGMKTTYEPLLTTHPESV